MLHMAAKSKSLSGDFTSKAIKKFHIALAIYLITTPSILFERLNLWFNWHHTMHATPKMLNRLFVISWLLRFDIGVNPNILHYSGWLNNIVYTLDYTIALVWLAPWSTLWVTPWLPPRYTRSCTNNMLPWGLNLNWLISQCWCIH